MKAKFILGLIFCATIIQAQNTIRGKITEVYNQQPLPGAWVRLTGESEDRITEADVSGAFRFDNVAPGRYSLEAGMLGFSTTGAQVVLTAGKEQVLILGLEESVSQLEGVEVTSKEDPTRPSNELVLISGRSFNADDTRRFAGSLNDPSRMVANFAGVSGANDARNDIIIRGNSPSGLLWRMEGIDIPNPNHFGAMGTTGGPVSMLNNNLLSNSDFLTGAFPAEYGNAMSGVFDLSLRNGNNEKREYTAQVGFNGFELGAEGPVGNNKGSYLINYRYSTMGLLSAVGVNFGTGAAIPEYQDLSFTLNLPTKKYGNFKVFAMGGVSNIDLIADGQDEENMYTLAGNDTYFGSQSGVLGFSHRLVLPGNWFSKITIAQTYANQYARVDSIVRDTENRVPFFGEKLSEHRSVAHWQLSKKFNARNYFRGGVIATHMGYNLRDSLFIRDQFYPRRAEDGQTQMLQTYGQWKHHFNENISGTVGLHGQYLHLNQKYQIEPRAALRWQVKDGHFLNFGLGRHSQNQPLTLLFFRDPRGDFPHTHNNRNLGFSQSDHIVVGYEWRKMVPWNIKVEGYFQHLSNIPVKEGRTFSMLNAGADFGIPGVEGLTNDGLGRNYGVELTVERSFSKGFYTLFTSSVFDAQYRTADGEWFNTAFNGNFVHNLLAGKEFKISESQLLSIDLKSTWAGGRRYTPIDEAASQAQGQTVYQNDLAFSEQFADYFRADIRVTYRINGKKTMHEWALDIQNVTNRRNVFMQQYDNIREEVYTIYQIGLFPMMFYRFYF
ncbi:MAG: TonB-dependent receptor [Cryomorphaceae bacterium]|nr:TonB-dependent receptor [Cryomorphaceae bacterium]